MAKGFKSVVMKYILLGIFLAMMAPVAAQYQPAHEGTPETFGEMISPSGLEEHLNILGFG